MPPIPGEPVPDLRWVPPPVIAHAEPLLARYGTVFCDVWGVLHDGVRPFAAAGEALARFRRQGGTVVLVSNAPLPGSAVADMLGSFGVRRDAWDRIVSGGDIALARVAEQGYRTVLCIGPADRDFALFDRLSARPASLEAADAIFCSGLDGWAAEAAAYRPLLVRALARKLPFVCANPDLTVDVGGTLYPCAGAIADLYERMGGEVFWAGKPHAGAFRAAREAAEQVRGEPVARARVLVIGDSVRTDLGGAEAAGLDALFVASGIHRADVLENGVLSLPRLAALLAPPAPPAVAAMAALAW